MARDRRPSRALVVGAALCLALAVVATWLVVSGDPGPVPVSPAGSAASRVDDLTATSEGGTHLRDTNRRSRLGRDGAPASAGPAESSAEAGSAPRVREVIDPIAVEVERRMAAAAAASAPDPLRARSPSLSGGGGAGGGFASARPPVEGLVEDAVTGAPIAAATLVLRNMGDETFGRTMGRTVSADDGTFVLRGRPRTGPRVLVRVRADGYEDVEAELGAGDTIRMSPREGAATGTLRGVVTDSEGAPLGGLLYVAALGVWGENTKLGAWADERGTFEIRGIAPGAWRVGIDRTGTNWHEVRVVAGGVTQVELTAERLLAPLASPPSSAWQEVVVPGLTDGDVVRATSGPLKTFLAVAEQDRARFALPGGIWTVHRPDDAAADGVDVRASPGDSAITLGR